MELLLIGLLAIIGESMKTMRTILLSKKIMKPVMYIVFVDAIIFSTGIKLISEGDSMLFTLLYATGKSIGIKVGDLIETKLAIGILEVKIYTKKEKMKVIADTLRSLGFSVTGLRGYGMKGEPRYILEITLARKDLSLLKEVLFKFGYTDATMVITEVKSVSGKISLDKIENYDKILEEELSNIDNLASRNYEKAV